MQSIFGALLTAGYATAVTAAISSSSSADSISASTEAQLTKSFAGAEAIAAQYPKDSQAIIDAARESFLQGDQWAYLAGVVAVLIGAALVAWKFPRKDAERALIASYEETDSR